MKCYVHQACTDSIKGKGVPYLAAEGVTRVSPPYMKGRAQFSPFSSYNLHSKCGRPLQGGQVINQPSRKWSYANSGYYDNPAHHIHLFVRISNESVSEMH